MKQNHVFIKKNPLKILPLDFHKYHFFGILPTVIYELTLGKMHFKSLTSSLQQRRHNIADSCANVYQTDLKYISVFENGN